MGDMRTGAQRTAAAIGAVAAGAMLAGGAALAGAGAAGAAEPAAAAIERGLVPVPGSAHEYIVHGITTPEDVLSSDKDLVLGGDVRATSTDGVTFHYFRLVDGVRIPMVRTPELCLPNLPCHAAIIDDTTPVY